MFPLLTKGCIFWPIPCTEGSLVYHTYCDKRQSWGQQRSMSHIAHPRNQFKSITHLRKATCMKYIISLIRRRKTPFNIIFFLRNEWSSFVKPWSPFTEECFVPKFVENRPVVLRKKIFNLCKCISTILLLFLLGKRHGPSFQQIWISFPQECIVLSLIALAPWFCRRRFFIKFKT